MTAPRVNFGDSKLLTLGVPFSLFLAGCLGPSSEGMPTPIQVPALDQFARCDYTYPTGGAVPCENLAIPVPVFPDRPQVGWVCTGGFVEPADRDRQSIRVSLQGAQVVHHP